MNTQNSTSDYQFFLFSKVYELEGFDTTKPFEELFNEITLMYNKYCKWFSKSNYNINDYYTMQQFLRYKLY